MHVGTYKTKINEPKAKSVETSFKILLACLKDATIYFFCKGTIYIYIVMLRNAE